jgi:eukaryotic-like serine/threonine-protein kinase
MGLPPGTRIGRLEIISALGAGGMGEVYRARDAELGRDVAIKVLPELFASDPERMARFAREAKVLASLNHSNIAAIYGFEDTGSVRALVLELVEGPTLAEAIALAGPTGMPIEDSLPIAVQIAAALEAAHERGIIHRDLKPANIKLRPDGTVKVLDFGLAKAMATETGSLDPGISPTITATRPDVILGTAAYMSPEQARGKAVDKRADVWAFGCVLYEMLTGVRVFGGDDVADSLAAVVRAEPDWSKLPPETPAPIRRLLRRSLEKDPRERLPDIGMARLEIKDALSATASAAEPTGAPRSNRSWLPWIVAALFAGLALAAFAWSLRRVDGIDPAPMRLEIIPPPGFAPDSLALSPDGRQLAFVAPIDGVPRIWVRQLAQETAQSLPGTDHASFPFWAPDGRSLGFFAGGKMQRIDLAGGGPQVLADVTVGRGASWSRDGVILFAPTLTSALMRVSASGGVPEPATRLAVGVLNHRWPHFLPDGRHFLFGSIAEADERGLYLGSLDGDPSVRLLEASAAGWYASGYLVFDVFDDAGVVKAVAFDIERRRVTGEPVPVVQNLFKHPTGRSASSLSSTGVFAYVRASFGHRRLVWMDRGGKIVGTVGQTDAAALANPELAPDGRRVAVTRISDGSAVWLIDVARGVPTRLTFGPGIDTAPFWSASGDRVLYRHQSGRAQDVFVTAANALGEAKALFPGRGSETPADWSPDGRVLLYAVPGDDLMAFDVERHKSFPVAQTTANEGWGQFSSDGRFVAYQSNESGRFEIYVRTFPGAEGKWLVSVAGGTQPRWARDGKELYYLAPDDYLMAVPLTASKTARDLKIGNAVRLFRTNMVSATAPGVLTIAAGAKQQYDVAPDGRFLINIPVAEGSAPTPISIVVNWPATLKR